MTLQLDRGAATIPTVALPPLPPALGVSVVVPTYRRLDLLDRCLAALVAQEFDPAAYEIVVADDAGCPDTRRQVEAWAARTACTGPTIRYVTPTGPAHGPAVARNAGWRAAGGPILAFTDDDCVPDPGWLRAGLAAFTDDDIIGVSGRVSVPLPDRPTDYERNAGNLSTAEFVTASCFYRRAAVEAVGGFDEQFTMAWREDSDLLFRLSALPGRMLVAPEALVVHPIRPAHWGVSLGQQRKSMFNALLYKKHPQAIHAPPPWRYYHILGALGLAGLALLGGRPRWALAPLAAWAWLTGQFCALRLRDTSHAPAHVAEMIITSICIPPLSVFWRLRGAIKYRVRYF